MHSTVDRPRKIGLAFFSVRFGLYKKEKKAYPSFPLSFQLSFLLVMKTNGAADIPLHCTVLQIP